MAACKICGRSVVAGFVVHADCLERRVEEVPAKICDSYCKWPEVCGSQEELEGEHCESCPMQDLVRLAE